MNAMTKGSGSFKIGNIRRMKLLNYCIWPIFSSELYFVTNVQFLRSTRPNSNTDSFCTLKKKKQVPINATDG